MKKITAHFRKHPLNYLLLAIPLALLAYWLGWGELWVFIFSALAIVPLAGYIGESTEALTLYTGPRIGGLLNATLGNAAELIITIVAIREGLLDLVKASITGSILGNVLLVLGMAFLLGGLRHGEQRFDSKHAGRNAILLLLAVIALVIPSLFSHSIGPDTSLPVEALSLGVAATMIVLYVAGLIYGYRTTGSRVDGPLEAPVGGDAELVRIVEKSHRTDDKAHPQPLVAAHGADRAGGGDGGRGGAQRAAGGGGRAGGRQPGHLRILRRDYPDPDHRQCSRAPGGGEDGHGE